MELMKTVFLNSNRHLCSYIVTLCEFSRCLLIFRICHPEIYNQRYKKLKISPFCNASNYDLPFYHSYNRATFLLSPWTEVRSQWCSTTVTGWHGWHDSPTWQDLALSRSWSAWDHTTSCYPCRTTWACSSTKLSLHYIMPRLLGLVLVGLLLSNHIDLKARDIISCSLLTVAQVLLKFVTSLWLLES